MQRVLCRSPKRGCNCQKALLPKVFADELRMQNTHISVASHFHRANHHSSGGSSYSSTFAPGTEASSKTKNAREAAPVIEQKVFVAWSLIIRNSLILSLIVSKATQAQQPLPSLTASTDCNTRGTICEAHSLCHPEKQNKTPPRLQGYARREAKSHKQNLNLKYQGALSVQNTDHLRH